jgi:flavin reductase (DIM6/NTAB) family NADH-FMN oxidoreductase RutF
MTHLTEPQRQLAAALGRIPSGLFVLTATRGDVETGMLVSWVQQCAFDPPHISVVIHRDRPIIPWLTEGQTFTLNVLDHTQTDMVAHFGRGFALGEPAFEGLDIDRPDHGAPVLEEALAYLLCRITSRCPVADHLLVLTEVTGGRVLGDGQPMVHIRKSGAHY